MSLDRPPSSSRFARLDALRGFAMVWMAVFHFCFDLRQAGWNQANFYVDPFWTSQRVAIVSLFLTCAAWGQLLAHDAGVGSAPFWRRWAQVAACAVLVSLGSYIMFPRSYISFGILHAMALMLPIGRWTAAWRPGWLTVLGLLALAAPHWYQSTWFDTRWTNWIGLVTHKPVTEDFVPLLPWLGVLWLAMAVGRLLIDRGPLHGAVPHWAQPLAHLGRWSLSFYMIHQPVLIGLVTAASLALGARGP